MSETAADPARSSHRGATRPASGVPAATTSKTRGSGAELHFAHEAFFYTGDQEYLAGTVPFIEEGLAAGEPVLVAVPAPRLELLESRFSGLGGGLLRFADMEELGRNPAWIIPAWSKFLAEHAPGNRPVRGVGEPIWAGRSDAELVECDRHEALLNLAFREAANFRLLCPYDMGSLAGAVLAGARRNHPQVTRRGSTAPSRHFLDEIPVALDAPLSPPPSRARTLSFDARSMAGVRHLATELAADAGMAPDGIEALAVAVSEAVTNSIHHGGGSGEVAMWHDGSRFLCEVRDRGEISDPLAGRRLPTFDGPGGRGLWLMNQLCDLVQIRSTGRGQLVRLHLSLSA